MNWWTKIFSAGASELVESVGGVLDELVTSDEERLQLKNAIEIEIMKSKDRQEERVLKHEEQITKRHENDMKSDSWLSKNVRPMTLIFLTITTVILAYTTIFTLPMEKAEMLQSWIALLTTLLVVVYTFYFGSRGIEKYQTIQHKQAS